MFVTLPKRASMVPRRWYRGKGQAKALVRARTLVLRSGHDDPVAKGFRQHH